MSTIGNAKAEKEAQERQTRKPTSPHGSAPRSFVYSDRSVAQFRRDQGLHYPSMGEKKWGYTVEGEGKTH